MIQVAGLLLCGLAAVGLRVAGGFAVLLGCWTAGLVLLAGLAAGGPSRRAATAAREALLAEAFGTGVLALAGLALVTAAGADRLDLVASALPAPDAGDARAGWAGLGLLLAVAGRLGLPPLPWWPARITAAPPAVRVFLLAGLHPVTALLLWDRLDAWLLPWHLTLASWLGGAVSLLAIMAAAGERQAARRAAWLGMGHWAGLLAAGGALPAAWVLGGGLALVQLQTILVRWPAARQRALLGIGGAAVITAGMLSGLASVDGGPALLRLAGALLSVWVLGRWWQEAAMVAALPPSPTLRRPAVAMLARLARLGQGAGPLPLLVGAAARLLGQTVAGFDRIVLAGVADGLGLIGLGLGWTVAWIDRRGQDLFYGGISRLLAAAGHATVRAAGGRPQRVLAVAVALILGLAWLGRAGG